MIMDLNLVRNLVGLYLRMGICLNMRMFHAAAQRGLYPWTKKIYLMESRLFEQ